MMIKSYLDLGKGRLYISSVDAELLNKAPAGTFRVRLISSATQSKVLLIQSTDPETKASNFTSLDITSGAAPIRLIILHAFANAVRLRAAGADADRG